jgi:hypothetical protein
VEPKLHFKRTVEKAMENLYTNSVEICNALATGTKRGVQQLRQGESHPGGRLLGSIGLLTAAAGVAIAALCSSHHRRLHRARQVANGASLLLAVAGIWTSQAILSAVLQPAAHELGQTLDQQWLKSHPVNYG